MRSRYHHLLLPLDFSPKNRWAVDVALEIARTNEAKVTLLHVVESMGALQRDAESGKFLDDCATRAGQELERFSRLFEDAGVTADYKVSEGKRAPEIVRFASEHGVDLIVMSSHPVDLQDAVHSLVTVSYQVGVGAACSVFLVKQPVVD